MLTEASRKLEMTLQRMLRSKFFVVCKCRGAQTLLSAECTAPGVHRVANAWGFPGG